ncbi:RNA polymerase sigma-70 factor [Mucilaginibacter sp. SMC90]|uniref:RNA polymerase sigma-70 factor n=1 Tax=Mucilaginibacter sp. SMC90 TaxID=2929803 RepID=UPI001FB1F08C|nr:RNA polymerase sigma-70 factor [Mucilaginibacter sp. SMC90]UOE47232.1 RNA polymerase sigma-70 factor [Mucilaginibacter sp. SMC90]
MAVLIAADDHGAFAELYERYFSVLYLHVLKKLRDKDEARDLMQELFAHIWARRVNMTRYSNIPGFLYASVRNRVFNIIDHKHVADKYLFSLAVHGTMEEAITDYRIRERQLAGMIESEINALPPKMREVFELSRKLNYTHREIAIKLNLSEQSVRSHVKGALRILRTKFGIFINLLFFFK